MGLQARSTSGSVRSTRSSHQGMNVFGLQFSGHLMVEARGQLMPSGTMLSRSSLVGESERARSA